MACDLYLNKAVLFLKTGGAIQTIIKRLHFILSVIKCSWTALSKEVKARKSAFRPWRSSEYEKVDLV